MNFTGAFLTVITNNVSSTGENITETSVPVRPTIKTMFDKNVVNDAVWELNQNQFSLQTQSGVNVPVNVTRISDQVNFNERRNIFITPVNDLVPGGQYNVMIGPDLTSRNFDTTLGTTTYNQGVTVSFQVRTVSAGGRVHIVRSGDTLWKIAQNYGTTVEALVRANNLDVNAFLYVGQRIVIPEDASLVYVVKPGDTLWEIAQQYGTTVEAISQANNLDPDDYLQIGQRLVIPSGTTQPVTYTVRAGDSLWRIAQRFGTTVPALARVNNLDPNQPLQIGQVLIIG